jgi:2-polyprenyl-3-methyl-5-hydroxy-6-metoxy-1,4-benzoquinol methylase
MQKKNFTPTNTPFGLSEYEQPYQVQRTKLLSDLIPAGNGQLAVDIGCGPGFFSRHLVGKNWITTSIDTDSENVKSASKFSQETRLGDAIASLTDFPQSKFDLALMLELIEHMPKEYGIKLLEQVSRTLKPGGELLISTPNKNSLEGLSGYLWKMRGYGNWAAWDNTHVHIYSAHELVKMLKQCGFEINKIVGYYYKATFPLIGSTSLPLETSDKYPLNHMGFNVIVRCTKT